MWFKNLIFYKLTEPFEYGENQLTELLAEQAFTPCGSQELSRYGWNSASNGLGDALLHSVSGFLMVSALKEEKILPGSVVRQAVEEKVAVIEREQARKVYRKERDQLKDEVVIDLLPRAFSRFQQTRALIAPKQGFIMVDASAHKRAEELLNLLRNTLGSLPVALPDVAQSPSAVMSHWLQQPQERPVDLAVMDECELRDNLAENGVIRIKGQELESDEFIAHLEAGKRVVKVAMEWQEKLGFVLDESLSLKRLKLTDQMKESLDSEYQDEEWARFDTDMTQMGLELTRLIPALLHAFGGDVNAKA
ncbi:recombination-associated protein RdgC [Marinobacterium arenosum]|uniref:recombination-associated protein RdgC n=1 Tax=Marinobacterium arenosum TaxID=2862496 RepID=UPI001C9718E4|nr:recombination-associated protein RdgC [Marinobacterium arenosum]MBY4677804.1 recombination-associated protein RdgC [Marinobacterium arenosum]